MSCLVSLSVARGIILFLVGNLLVLGMTYIVLGRLCLMHVSSLKMPDWDIFDLSLRCLWVGFRLGSRVLKKLAIVVDVRRLCASGRDTDSGAVLSEL